MSQQHLKRGDKFRVYNREINRYDWVHAIEDSFYNEASKFEIPIQYNATDTGLAEYSFDLCEWYVVPGKYNGDKFLLKPNEINPKPKKPTTLFIQKALEQGLYWKYHNPLNSKSDIIFFKLIPEEDLVVRVYEVHHTHDQHQGNFILSGRKDCSFHNFKQKYFKKHQINVSINPCTKEEYQNALLTYTDKVHY